MEHHQQEAQHDPLLHPIQESVRRGEKGRGEREGKGNGDDEGRRYATLNNENEFDHSRGGPNSPSIN
jgi:hypothetical protein